MAPGTCGFGRWFLDSPLMARIAKMLAIPCPPDKMKMFKASVMPNRNVSLTPKLESFVKDQVAGGMYKTASEVHRVALASLMRRDEERQLRVKKLDEALQRGLDDLEKGRYTSISSEEEQDAFFKGVMKRVANNKD